LKRGIPPAPGGAGKRRKESVPRPGAAASGRRPAGSLISRLGEVGRWLEERYGRPGHCAHETDPVRNLILTILSQNTTDRNRDRAYASLMERYPTLPGLAAAKPKDVEDAIRVGGLANAKAKAILSALARMKRERGAFTLGHLGRMPLAEARAELLSYPGVGVKTANILLLFSFGMDAFPVDTHILRVAKRLGLVPASYDLARAALRLEPRVPKGQSVPLHLNLIRLGREICSPRNPRHAECPLLAVCPEGRRAMRVMKQVRR